MGFKRQFTKLQKKVTWLYEISGAALLRERMREPNGPNAVFLWIPKTAGTSVFETLGPPPLLKTVHQVRSRFANKGLVSFGHMDYRRMVHEGLVSKAFDESAYKFAFSRNPYDRIVSLYFYSQRVDRLPKELSFLDFCRQLVAKPCEPIGLYNSIGLSQCNPQSRWLEGIEVDFVGRLESLDKDVTQVLAALGREPANQVPHLNSTKHRSYSDYFCDESRQIIDDLFDEDFRNLGYEKTLAVDRKAA